MWAVGGTDYYAWGFYELYSSAYFWKRTSESIMTILVVIVISESTLQARAGPYQNAPRPPPPPNIMSAYSNPAAYTCEVKRLVLQPTYIPAS